MTLTQEERVALTFIAHNDPRDGFVRRTWLEFKAAICGLLQRTRSNGWISVEERLPEEGQRVIACLPPVRSGDSTDVCEATFNKANGWFATEYGCYTATHWMPLPEPPEVT